MLMPSIFNDNLFDDFFRFPDFRIGSVDYSNQVLKTDVKEKDGLYEMTMNLPGIKKDDVKITLENGYLTVQATANSNKDEKDKDGKYIRRERYAGTCSRSFYVGDAVTEDDIKAKFEDGTLKVDIPKKESVPEVEQKKYIAIE